MPEYTIAARELPPRPRANRMRQPARAAHAGSQIRRSNGIRRNTAALSPNDAVELSKVTMTNLSGAGAVTPCLMVWASRHSIVSVESGCTDTPRLAARLD
jgi:hypothetical protein